MNRDKIVICDSEEKYCYRLDSYLRKHLKIKFTLLDYTDPDELIRCRTKKETVLLIIAEKVYRKTGNAGFDRVLIMDEINDGSETKTDDSNIANVMHISKYSTTDRFIDKIMEICMEYSEDIDTGVRMSESKMTLSAFYSPISRCLQTTTAITKGQIFAQSDRTLYINLEPYGEYVLNENENCTSLSDLLYYNECSHSSLKLMLEKSKVCMGGLDMIYPVSSPGELLSVTSGQWLKLFNSIEKISDYHNLILDLSDCIIGLFDILRHCDKIYTIVRDDSNSVLRQQQYEKILNKQGYEDIMIKTEKLKLPVFSRLPRCIEGYSESEVAQYLTKHSKNSPISISSEMNFQ